MRHREGKLRTLAELALDANIAVHQVEVFLDDIESEANTIEFAGVGFSDLRRLVLFACP